MNSGKYDFEALRAPSERAENGDILKCAGSGAFRLTPARGRSSGAPKNARVFRGRPNLVEPAWPSAPQGAARVGETRGADARRRRRSAQPLVRRWAPLLLFWLLGCILKLRRFDVRLVINAVDFFQNGGAGWKHARRSDCDD